MLITLLTLSKMNSQTSTNMITFNIQQHLMNKYWSSNPSTTNEIVFRFNDDGNLYLYTNEKEIGNENYYITNIDCTDNSLPFDESKINTSSSGNYIKTVPFYYVIEFYSDFQKFRIRATYDSNWQIFYLAEGFVPK
jgi:hypothetical protein